VPRTEPGDGGVEGVGSVGRAVVSEDALDPDAEPGELSRGRLKGEHRTRGGLVGHGHDDGIARGVVDHDLEMLIAGRRMLGMLHLIPTADAPAATVGDAAKLLVVLVQEGSRMAGDIADRRRGHPVGVAQPAEAAALEDPVHGRRRQAQEWSQSIRAIPPTGAGGQDLDLDRSRQPPRRTVRPGAPIEQASLAFDPVAADPLVGGRPADPELLGHVGRRPAGFDPANQELSAEYAQSRSSMSHESPPRMEL